MIQMPTQTEVTTWAQAGIAYRRPDSDEPGNRFRIYEVAGMPHNNSRDSPAFRNDPCTLPVTVWWQSASGATPSLSPNIDQPTGVIQPTPAPPGSVRMASRPTSGTSKIGFISFAPAAMAFLTRASTSSTAR